MVPKPDLEGIILRLGDPFHGTEEALAILRSSKLTGLADVQQYARKLMDVYQTATNRIDRAVEEARTRGQTVIDQYSRSPESGDILGDPMEEYDPQVQKARVLLVKQDVEQKLRDVESEAKSKRNEILKRLQQELVNDYVGIRTFMGYVIFKTQEGTYGLDLDEPDKGIREAVPVMIFERETYLLKKKVAPIPENK